MARWLPVAPIPPEQVGSIAELANLSYVPSRGMLVRRDDWDAVGGMDPGYYPVLWADVDFCRRLTDIGRRFGLVASAMVAHPGNASTTPAYSRFLHERNARRFRRLHGERARDAPVDERIPPATLRAVAQAAAETLSELAGRYTALSLAPHSLRGIDAPLLPDDVDEPGSDDQTNSTRDADFSRIYERVIRFSEAEVLRANPAGRLHPIAEPPETARYSALGIPESALLAIADDRQFVIAAFAKLLDRLPSPADLDDTTRRLAIRATTRSAVIDRLLGSDEYRAMAAQVEVHRQ